MKFLFRILITSTAVVVAISFQGYKGEVKPQVGQEIPAAEEGAQMMQLTQVQLAQIVSSAVSQALTQHVQQTASNPPLGAAAESFNDWGGAGM